MGSKREDVDLEIVLKDPACARKWVKTYNWNEPDPPNHIVIDRGLEWERTVYFESMTDDEAVEVAWLILHDFEIVRSIQELNLLAPSRHVH